MRVLGFDNPFVLGKYLVLAGGDLGVGKRLAEIDRDMKPYQAVVGGQRGQRQQHAEQIAFTRVLGEIGGEGPQDSIAVSGYQRNAPVVGERLEHLYRAGV